MWSNTKVLSITSLLIILIGLVLLGFGLRPITDQPASVPFPVSSTPPATSSAIFGIEGEKVTVTEVVDGDTIKVGNTVVRFLGIDTPETKDPRKPVQCYGKEASNETKKLLLGKSVILEKDVSETDKYGRLLRYIYLQLVGDQLLFVNDYLIREGFAKALTYPPDVKYTERFLEAQKEAKELNRGLWGRC